MPQTATIKSLPVAFATMKAMQAQGVEWGEDYRGAARQALAALLEGRMDQLIDVHLERMAALGQADRRNGCYTRWLLLPGLAAVAVTGASLSPRCIRNQAISRSFTRVARAVACTDERGDDRA